jgi:hypothetical protein
MKAIVCFTALLTAAMAAACHAADFSADIVTVSPEGTFNAKMYVSGDKSRTEIEGTATIARADKGIVWVLIPAQKMYIEQPLDMRTAASTKEKLEGEIERSAVGHETVNGIGTTKYRVVFEAQGQRGVVFQWIDEARRIPVKTAAGDGSWSSEFKNIRTNAQDSSLFEIPAGYSKMPAGIPDMKQMMAGLPDDE